MQPPGRLPYSLSPNRAAVPRDSSASTFGLGAPPRHRPVRRGWQVGLSGESLGEVPVDQFTSLAQSKDRLDGGH